MFCSVFGTRVLGELAAALELIIDLDIETGQVEPGLPSCAFWSSIESLNPVIKALLKEEEY